MGGHRKRKKKFKKDGALPKGQVPADIVLIKAKYKGQCYACKKVINPGTSTLWSPTTKKVRHHTCPGKVKDHNKVGFKKPAYEVDPERLGERFGTCAKYPSVGKVKRKGSR